MTPMSFYGQLIYKSEDHTHHHHGLCIQKSAGKSALILELKPSFTLSKETKLTKGKDDEKSKSLFE